MYIHFRGYFVNCCVSFPLKFSVFFFIPKKKKNETRDLILGLFVIFMYSLSHLNGLFDLLDSYHLPYFKKLWMSVLRVEGMATSFNPPLD